MASLKRDVASSAAAQCVKARERVREWEVDEHDLVEQGEAEVESEIKSEPECSRVGPGWVARLSLRNGRRVDQRWTSGERR